MSDGPSTENRGLARSLVRWLAARYYPRIEISDAGRIPQTGPVLLCANHANSLFDPVLIGIAAGRPVRFMAKAPLFETPVLGPAMSALGMIPAFRGSDDASQVRRNIESLDVGANVLVQGSAMGIFPEGKSTDQAHVEMVRSGAARMAIQAEEEGAKGVQVVPIGITYEQKDRFLSSVWIQVGEPIDVDECLAQHDGDARAARRGLTQELENRLKDVVVHLDEPDWEPWIEDLQTLAEPPQDPAHEPMKPLRLRKRIANAMNWFLAHDREQTESLAAEIKSYRERVEAAGLTIDSPVLRMHGLKVLGETLWHLFCLIVLFLPALLGTLHHLVPFVVARNIAARLDQPGRKTISTNRMLVGVPVYLLWYVLVAWWMFGYYSTWFACTWLIAAPFCGMLAINYWRRAGRMIQLLWHQLQIVFRREELEGLRQQESALREHLRKLAGEYAEHVPRPEPVPRQSRKRRWGRVAARIAVVLLVAAIAWVARYQFFDKPLSGSGLDLKNMSPERIDKFLSDDEAALVSLIERIDVLTADAGELQREFADGRRSFTNQADDDDFREVMRRYLTYREALLRIIWRHQQYAELADEERRHRAFLVDFTAAAVLYQTSLKFVHRYGTSSAAIAKLNEPEPHWGIPAGVYDMVRHNLASPQNIRMFELARQYYHQPHVQDIFETYGLSPATPPYDQFHAAIADAEETIAEIDDSVPERIVEVAMADLQGLFHDAQYETQSVVSTWIGDFKIRQPRDGESLIDEEQLARLSEVLQPGDILLERRNWYLSNAFLPGYWPHGAVYVGTAEDLRRRGLDENEHVRERWEEFIAPDPDGHEHVIIEAVSEGVIFSSLEHSIGGADSVAVLRPNVTEEEKNEAIVRAFSFTGRPYDFEFDFETPSMLVCTEVVFRTYGGNSGTIRFPLEEIMGRQTMPAINLVRKFNDEYGADDAQLEFIAFIDGDETTATSRFLTDAHEFRGTLDRPALSFVQGSDPYALKSIGLLGQVLIVLTALAAVWVVGGAVMRRARP